MHKLCKHCKIVLDENNRAGAHLLCKPCKSKKQVAYDKANPERRRLYANAYARKIGKVKQHPCLTCSKLCYKKYAKAFCSDKCRFMSYVKVTDECWIWMGAVNRRGYGKLCFQKNNTDTAHRVSYKLFNGPIENDLYVCHSCDNPACVKPGHLWLGTNKENMMDMVEKGRQHSRLQPKDILKIRELHEKFGVSQKKIMEQFKISCGYVSLILSRKAWKHV